MNRREVIAGVGSAALWPLTASAQGVAKMPRVGILVLGNPDPALFLKTFRDAMRERGYHEGESVAFELRSANGDPDRLPAAAAELGRLEVDVIVAWQTPPATAAKNATKTIPIVLAGVGDPVGTGLVDSLARPGANVTGLAGMGAELGAKNLELIRELMPAARRVGVLLNGPDPFSRLFRQQIALAADRIELPVHFVVTSRSDDLDAAMAEVARERVDIVLAQPSLPQRRTVETASRHRLAVVSPNRNFAAAGALMSYAANQASLWNETAAYVDRILRGAKPAELPVQGPKIFEMIVNLKTANALDLKVPQTLLARADEVIE
jgi:putative ABC transport system substrate-binding protein